MASEACNVIFQCYEWQLSVLQKDPGHNIKTKKKGQEIFTGKDLRDASNVVLHIPSFVEIETEPHCYRSGAPSFSTFAVASTFSTPHAKGRTENPDN